jgi:MFS family permease
MSGISTRLIVVGLPTIGRELHAGPDELVWFTQAFLIAGIASTVLVGRIADVMGRIQIYKAGFAVFTVAAALCALSSTGYELIIFRVIQGCGSAMILTNATAIVTDASPANELGTMLSINSAGFNGGAMFGLTLSGLILSFTDWRVLFIVNVPIGIFGTLWAHRRLREISTRDVAKEMDWVGIVLFTGGLLLITLSITFLSYGLSFALSAYGLLALGASMLIVFAKVETNNDSPFLDLSLFRLRLFAAGNLAQLFNSITWMSVSLMVAFYLQLGLGYSALQTGLAILPSEISYLSLSLMSGRLSDKYGNAILSTSGLTIIFLGFLEMSTLDGNASYLKIAFVLLLIGSGNGLFNSPNNRTVMSSVPPNRRGVAAAIRSLMFQTGSLLSYGLIILFLSFGIPYGTLSELLQESLSGTALAVARTEFFSGFRIAVLALAIIDVGAIAMSLVRGRGSLQGHHALRQKGRESARIDTQ